MPCAPEAICEIAVDVDVAGDVGTGQAELARRRAEWEAARQPSQFTRGWYKLYIDTVMQADVGADLDFLVGKSSSEVTRESH